MLRALILATFFVVMPGSTPGQSLRVLHVTVVLVDGDGRSMPVPRHALLVSDEPPTSTPRKVVTALDGTVEVRLRPGTYVVESDRPVALDGRAYQWRQVVEIAAGGDTTLELTAENAEVETATSTTATPDSPATSGAPPANASSSLLARWQDSVVGLWTPTLRALGVVVDARGLVATNQRIIGDATPVEVQLSPTVKVAARLLAADSLRDVAILWIDSAVTASIQPVPLNCGQAARSPVLDGQEVFTIDVPFRGEKSLTSGTASRIEPHALSVDFRLEPRSTGGPVFTADGGVVGITSRLPEESEMRGGESPVVAVEDVCQILRSAESKMREVTPPSGTHLPVEPTRPFPVDALQEAAKRRGGAGPYRVSSSDFDITFITPVLTYAALNRWGGANGRGYSNDPRNIDPAQERLRLLTDFGNWSEYVADIPPVVLVRVTPRLVEGFWTMVARGAAQTQGVSLPPIKNFKPAFSRMRAFCGDAEVMPIHAFTLQRRISDRDAIREGVYAFAPGALGPPCGTVKLVLFSEKEPKKGDTQVVDPGVLQQVWQDFAPYSAPKPQPDVRPGP